MTGTVREKRACRPQAWGWLCLGLQLLGCASSVGSSPDALAQDVSAEAAVDATPPDVEEADVAPGPTTDVTLPASLACSGELLACGQDGGCPNDCTRYCDRWSASRKDGSVYQADPVCFVGVRASCFAVLASNVVCPPGLVCTFTNPDVPGGCIRADQCLAYREQFRNRAPAGVPQPDCWYSDLTLPLDGQVRAAQCLASNVRTCGVGCEPCLPGTTCLWTSERAPTGLCLRRETQARINGSPCTPAVPAGRTLAFRCNSRDRCLRPIRGNVDGRRDEDREGVCVPAEACLAAQQALPGSYVCDPFPSLVGGP